MSKIESYVSRAINIANDNTHGYSQYRRWGNPDYDCSSFVITCVNAAGIPVRNYGATYTGNMYNAFIRAGFKDVTRLVNLATGAGLQRGDILLNVHHHTEMYIGNGQNVGAHYDENRGIRGAKGGDQTGQEISVGRYYNYPWNYVLRYNEPATAKPATPARKSNEQIATEVIQGKWGNYPARKTALEKAGYNYATIQSIVNSRKKTTTPRKKSNTQIAREVIQGKWGNYPARKTALEKAGYNYAQVQAIVNKLTKK